MQAGLQEQRFASPALNNKLLGMALIPEVTSTRKSTKGTEATPTPKSTKGTKGTLRTMTSWFTSGVCAARRVAHMEKQVAKLCVASIARHQKW